MPKLVTSTMTKSVRAGKVFLDWSQNSGSKTTIAPYSLRGREQPTVAAPRTWEELDDPGLRQLRYDEVLARVARDGDLLAPLDADVGRPGSADQIPQHARRVEDTRAGAQSETCYRPRQYVRHPGTPRPPAALRLPAGTRRRAGVVGGAEKSARDHVGEPSGGAHRGSSAGIRRVRGQHPQGRVRRRQGDHLGLRHLRGREVLRLRRKRGGDRQPARQPNLRALRADSNQRRPVAGAPDEGPAGLRLRRDRTHARHARFGGRA